MSGRFTGISEPVAYHHDAQCSWVFENDPQVSALSYILERNGGNLTHRICRLLQLQSVETP